VAVNLVNELLELIAASLEQWRILGDLEFSTFSQECVSVNGDDSRDPMPRVPGPRMVGAYARRALPCEVSDQRRPRESQASQIWLCLVAIPLLL
jgi:hypothetical protein